LQILEAWLLGVCDNNAIFGTAAGPTLNWSAVQHQADGSTPRLLLLLHNVESGE
jgi:hypothetical protein